MSVLYLKKCYLHGYMETRSDYCPVSLGREDICDLKLGPAKRFVSDSSNHAVPTADKTEAS